MSDNTKCPDCGSVILKRYSGGVRYECWTERIDPIAESSIWFNRSSACVIIAQLHAEPERVTKERDELIEKNEESIRLYVECNKRANWAEVRASDMIKERDTARKQRDRAMELMCEGLNRYGVPWTHNKWQKSNSEYRKLREEITKEKEQG